jgi:hypothetical protein
MDDLERAEQESERHLSVLIKNARAKNKQSSFAGHCRYCNEIINHGAFCNEWCRSDYEVEQIIKSRQGRA